MAAKKEQRLFWFAVGLAAAVLAIILIGMSQSYKAGDISTATAPMGALAGIAVGFFFGDRGK
ncbi:hypothetical protein [Streptomyces sp. NPDC001880]